MLRFKLGGNFANREDFSGFNNDEVAENFGGSIGREISLITSGKNVDEGWMGIAPFSLN